MADDDPLFLSLFTHKLRADWGIGVLASEADGKRRYLFEDGEERTLAEGFHQMMRRVEEPDADQQAVYARLKGELAKRENVGKSVPPKPTGFGVLDQLAVFRQTYPAGLADPQWIAETRGEPADQRAPRHRDPMIRDAQERLSREALTSLTKGHHFAELWKQVTTVLEKTDLVPPAQLKLRAPGGEEQRTLAMALRELLYGKAAYGRRFDKYLAAFRAAFGQPPSWELATAVCALVFPTEHVCVDPTLLRRQLGKNSSRRTISPVPNSTGYASCLGMARQVANRLAEQGEVPRDLLEVRDFVGFAPRRRSNRARTGRKLNP